MHIKNRVMETQIDDSDRQGLGLSLIISRILTFLHTTHYIFNKEIFTFTRCFYPKRLTVHSGYTFFCQYVCPGNRTHNLCTANTML